MEKDCYHTQECRGTEKLTHPIKCKEMMLGLEKQLIFGIVSMMLIFGVKFQKEQLGNMMFIVQR